jgi:small GTP-binding protein
LGPLLAKLIDSVASERPAEVVDFLLVQLQNANSLDHKKTPIRIKDPFVPSPPDEIISGPRAKLEGAIAAAGDDIVNPTIDAMRMDSVTSIGQQTPSSETKATQPAPAVSDAVPDLKHIQFAMLGISGAGKSSIVNSLVGKFDFKIKPSIGFKPVSLMLGETTNVRFYDLGGGKKIRDIWGDYFHDVHAVIYVVDASAGEEQLAEALDVFQHTVTHKYLAGKPLLLLANKQDKEGARSSEVLSEIFGMKRFVHSTARDCCSFVKVGGESETKESAPEEETPEYGVDPRFEASLEWLLNIVQENYPDLNERVEADTVLKKKEEAKKRIERERKVLKNKIAAAFRDEIDPSILPPDLPAPLPDDIFLHDEAASFIAGEIGVEVANLEPIALEIIALVGYQRLAMQIIGALKSPISKKKVPMSWDEIRTLISDLRAELGLSRHLK